MDCREDRDRTSTTSSSCSGTGSLKSSRPDSNLREKELVRLREVATTSRSHLSGLSGAIRGSRCSAYEPTQRHGSFRLSRRCVRQQFLKYFRRVDFSFALSGPVVPAVFPDRLLVHVHTHVSLRLYHRTPRRLHRVFALSAFSDCLHRREDGSEPVRQHSLVGESGGLRLDAD